MSVEDNIRIAKKALEAFNAHDLDSFMEFYAEDALHFQPTQLEPIKGRQANREDYEKVSLAPFPDVQFEMINIFGQDDWLCVQGVFKGTHKAPLEGPAGEIIPPTNKAVQVPICMVAKMKNGEAIEVHEYNDQLGFLAQLGIM